MIYYVDGNFSLAQGIEVGSVTLHPSGLPARPAARPRREVARHDRDARARRDVRHVPPAEADDARGATSTTASYCTRGPRIRPSRGRRPPTTTRPASRRTSSASSSSTGTAPARVRDSSRGRRATPRRPGRRTPRRVRPSPATRCAAEVSRTIRRDHAEARRPPGRSRMSSCVHGFHELVERYRPVIVSSGLPRADRAGPRARGRRGRAALRTASSATPEGWRVRFRDEARLPGLRRPLQAPRRFPTGARSSTSATATPTAARRSRADRVFARDDLADYLDEQERAVRAVRDLERRCCCASLSRTTSSSRPSASARSAPTSRTSGTTTSSTASSAGREVRIEAAPGGVDVEPLDDVTRPVVEQLLGMPFELDPFYAWAADDAVLAPSSSSACAASGRRSRRTRSRALVTSITAQQVSLFAAFAIRSRLVERFGVRGRVVPRRSRRASGIAAARRGGARRARLLAPQGRVRGRPRPRPISTSTGSRRSTTTRSARGSRRSAGLGPWTAEWFLARHLARPRAWPAGDLGLRKAAEIFYGVDVHELGPRLDPFQNLSAHYLLTGCCAPHERSATPPSADEAVAARALGGVRGARCRSRRASSPRRGSEEWADIRREHRERRRLPRRGRRRAGRHGRRLDDAEARHDRTSQLVYVRPRARRQGVAKALLRQCVRAGARARRRRRSRSTCCRERGRADASGGALGFEEVGSLMATPLDALERRLAERADRARRAPTTHVQTDDDAVGRARGRAVRAAARGAGRRAATSGWIRDQRPGLDATATRRAASRASSPTGSARSSSRSRSRRRGRPLPALRARPHGRRVPLGADVTTASCSKGDELALAANPTLVARLTGADRDEVRRVARTAASPADLPPAEELYEQIAATMGLEP